MQGTYNYVPETYHLLGHIILRELCGKIFLLFIIIIIIIINIVLLSVS